VLVAVAVELVAQVVTLLLVTAVMVVLVLTLIQLMHQ
jgi:hypothetical protein